MADRDITDVLTMLRALRDYRDDLRAEIPGFVTLLEAIENAAVTDEPNEENDLFLDAVKAQKDALNALWEAQAEFATATAMMLGRYAGSPDLSDFDRNLAAFNDKLVADSDEFEIRNLSKFSAWSAGGSNVGNGTAFVHNIDPAFGGDISHVETKTARCVKSYPDVDRPVFVIEGAARGKFAYLEGGSSVGNAYNGAPAGIGSNAPGAGQTIGQTGQEIEASGLEESDGNLVIDGGFEAASLDSEDANWTKDSGGNDVTINTSSPIDGDQDLKFAADGQVSQSVAGRVFPGRVYALEVWHDKDGTVSAGNLVVKLTDGATDHITLTIANSGMSTSAAKATYGTVRIPASAKCDLMEVSIAEASMSGGGTVKVDRVVLRELTILDGGQAIGFADGPTGFKAQNDVFTGAITGGTDGTLQRQNNELLGRGFEADGTATDWADS